ncbi:MAG: hypothetical protein AMXMBFR64_24170 [Myxococcales bacterium]
MITSRKRLSQRLAWLSPSLILAAGLGAACNDVPVAGVLDSFSAQVTDERSNTDAVKLDILWVIDNSVSMCQEQNALAANINEFIGKITGFVNVDVRLAVVTTDGLSEKEMGKFHHELPKPFPPNCLERRVEKCLTDGDCEKALKGKVPTPSGWVCEPPSQGAQYLTNTNGSLNSNCRKSCTDNTTPASTSAQCCGELVSGGDTCRYQCIAPGGDMSLRGCINPPAVDGCPAKLPAWVDAEVAAAEGQTVADLFRCMAVVGALQDKNPQLEMGLRTALLALDVNGPNANQAKSFLRQDAYQVIIFVSDEEDCSVSPQMPKKFLKNGTLVAEAWQVCGLLGDTDGKDPIGGDIADSEYVPKTWKDSSGKGPLEPVSTFINGLRSVNSDPSRVLVAAIVGGVVGTGDGKPAPGSDPTGALKCPTKAGQDAAECEEERIRAYLKSKGGPGPLAKNTYICESAVGQSDWGGRYLQVVKAFGKNGVATNICSPAGFGEALDKIADTILRRVVRICVDEPVKLGTGITVTKTFADGTFKALEEGEDKDYVIRPADDCGAGQAIFFNEVLEPKQKVNVSYEAPIYKPSVSN